MATAPTMIRPWATYWATGGKPRKNMTLIITLEQQAAGERAAHRALAAEEADAAEHGGGDRVEREGAADDRIARARLRGDEEAGEGRQQAADRIGGDPRAVDRYAGAKGADRVVAGGIEAEAERRGLLELPHANEQHTSSTKAVGRVAGQQIGEPVGNGAAGRGQDQQRRAADDEGAGERDDDRRQAKPRPR